VTDTDTDTGTVPRIDTLTFFDDLATAMNGASAAYEVLGDVDMDLGVEMVRPGQGPFRVRLSFRGIQCTQVVALEPDEAWPTDCVLEGPLDAWAAMFADVRANGHATGRQTINSLTLLADRIAARGTDPLGIDKFFRFNQTVQAFLDGAAGVAPAPVRATTGEGTP